MSASARIACASPQFVDQAEPSLLDDWLTYYDPSIVLLTGRSPEPRAASHLRRQLDSETLLYHPASDAPASGPRRIDGVQFVLSPTEQTLCKLREYEHRDLNVDRPSFVLSGLLELDVDTTSLSTTLVGREEYVSSLQTNQLEGEYVHISASLPADYRREWDGLSVIGGGIDSGYAGTPLVALDCRDDGRVLTRSVTRSQLGLRALDQVGGKRAQQLREAGFTSREDIASTSTSSLSDLPGLGQTIADRIQQSATAIAHDEIVRKSDDPLPNGDPVYIDIETDGLSPTITWLIGVLDGTATDGRYLSFIQTNPDEPGRAIEDFLAWYTANASHRPLVAYRGWKFDFSVILDHIIEYCPHYEDDWNSTYRFDPYQWAVEKQNAILPGRTNKLEDVAAALGYERDETGLTGAAVARTYQQWMADRSPSTEPDWDRFESYCEDDVRGLAVIYESLAKSNRIVSTNEPSRDITETTTQQRLSDW
ncbi:RecB family nuclease, putative, TM0106 family [Halopenitus malekzadehii]|uniref:RecB family nuclease, putative, TM0106 family n=1 Tax=Halopenitus malekzadehii TaxID=1267564 RepID=A0A1H6J3Q6_9EURY|nr:ribonuclease H-like domain-containing protein [Halopenitus malekzadehii]SEH56259.1 RecB family nuclease, putative, TM0106 family [Halopenitus malekzadehii]